MSVSKKFKVLNKVGLHARPAAKFVRAAASFKENTISVENLSKESDKVNAKSFTCVLSIGANQDDEVQVTVEGDNAEAAMEKFSELFDNRFGEDE
jgi:phosphotransferase system HPr (HPr) family protein